MRVWAKTKVLDSFTGVLGSTEEKRVGASWGPQGDLVNGERLTTSLLDAGAGSRGEAESGDGQLWNI